MKPSSNQKPRPSRPIEAYSSTINADGVPIRVACFRIYAPRGRFEVRLDGAGQQAVIDLPLGDEGVLEQRIASAVQCFAGSVRLRLRGDGRLP